MDKPCRTQVRAHCPSSDPPPVVPLQVEATRDVTKQPDRMQYPHEGNAYCDMRLNSRLPL